MPDPKKPNIESLNRGQSPPDDQDWIMVEKAVSGYYVNQAASKVGVSQKGPFKSFQDAVEAAALTAQRCGIDTVFTKDG